MTATVTGMTAAAMLAIAEASIVDADRVGDGLVFTRGDGTLINLGEFVTKERFDEQGGSGREIAVAESTTYQTGMTGAPTDITGLSITFTVIDRPVYVEAELPWVQCSAAAGAVVIVLADAANVDKRWSPKLNVASELFALRVAERISTPGTYTRKVRIWRTSGTVTFSNNANPGSSIVTSYIRAIER